MKYTLLLNILVLAQLISAQSFTEAPQNPPLTEANNASADFADVNGNGYPDLLITGDPTKLYINDGLGNFTERMNTPFPDIFASDAAFSDVNNDGHPDVFMMGSVTGPDAVSKLYINDGLGNFTERVTSDFVGITYGSVAFADVDGDGDQDLLTVGYTGADVVSPGEFVSILYLNDGLGNFTEKENTPFEGVARSSVAFADVNGDGHPDVFTTGENNSSLPVPKLYINNGAGDFTERLDIPFFEAERGSVAFSDFNGNGHMDLLITGQQTPLRRFSRLYMNDGDGNFTEKSDTPFEDVDNSSVAVADVNQNGHMDVFIMGFGVGRISKLYLNDGDANFTEVIGTAFVPLSSGDAAFEDVNGDGYPDLLIAGDESSSEPISKLYINDGMVSSSIDHSRNGEIYFKPYPNPTTNSQGLTIQYHTENLRTISIKMYDLNGVIINQQSELAMPENHSYVIPIATLTSGTYIVELSDGINSTTKKVIVE